MVGTCRYLFRLGLVLLAALGISVAVAGPVSSQPASRPSFGQPALSPDGRRIALVADGAIWSVAATGGVAHLLVADAGTDSRPLFSPDGRSLAFVSSRTGNGDIYLLDLADGSLRRLTWSDAPDRLSGFSRDGRWVYFDSSRDNIGGMQAVYRVRVSGGTPMPVSMERYRNEEEGVPSPDNRMIALVGGGWGAAQWWRHGHAHIDDGAIWLLRNDGSHIYRQLSPDHARALWPMWSADGKSLYYMSDRSGTENIWKIGLHGQETAITHFTTGRCLWPSIAANGQTIVLQRNFNIWTLDTATGVTHKVPIHLQGAVVGPGVQHRRFTSKFSNLLLSPDGKKLVFIAHGQIFAGSTSDPGRSSRITHTPAAQFDVAWSADSRRIVYVSDRDGIDHLFLYEFASGREKRLTDGVRGDADPQFSPNGKYLAFIRGGKRLQLLSLENGRLKTLAQGDLDLKHPLESSRPLAWSPDGRWLAFLQWGARMYRNVQIVSITGGAVRTVSYLGNTFADSLGWSPDGRSLWFSTGQRTEPGQIARLDLLPRSPRFREQQFLDLFKESTPPGVPGSQSAVPVQTAQAGRGKTAARTGKKIKVRIDFAGIAQRLQLLPVGLNVQAIHLSQDGKTLLFTAQVAGRTNIYTWSINPLASKPPVARQLTSTPGAKSNVQFAADGKSVWYLDSGRIFHIPLKGGVARRYAASAEMNVDFNAEKQVVFEEAWRWLADNFHDPKMNGVDWNAVRKKYAPLVAGAGTPATLHRLLKRMVGELDASHSGVRGPGRRLRVTAHLGLQFAPRVYEQTGRLQIKTILPLGPVAVAGGAKVGDYLLAVNGMKLGASTNLDASLAHRMGRETRLTLATDAQGRDRHTIKVKPINSPVRTRLIYRAWVEHNRKLVARLSHGQLGYVHLPDMSMRSLQRLYREIDAQNATGQGVVIDVRNNYGGFVNAYALDVLARRHYLNMTFRGMSRVSARPVLGQRALERPTVLITNRITLSDGEDFTEGYEELGLGKVVGEPTAGWIIYTSNARMVDGATVRLPFITVTTAQGRPMEQHPRPVDVKVAEPLGGSYRHRYPRLETAVQVLMQQIKKGR